MSSHFVYVLLAIFVSLIKALPQIKHRYQERGTCHSNNCLRALEHNSAAVQFCDAFIPVSTITVSNILTSTETFDNEFTQPYTTVIVTNTSNRFTTTTFTRSHTLPTNPFPPTTTSTNTHSTLSTAPYHNSTHLHHTNTRREFVTPPSLHPLPTFLSACNFNPEKISSACSCLVAPITQVTRNFTTYVVTDRIQTLPTLTSTIGTVVVKTNTTTVTLYEP